MGMKTRFHTALMMLALVMAPGGTARGGDDGHERARRALEASEARPLVEILEAVRGQLGGEVVGVELDREHGRYVYEFKVVTPAGRLSEVHVDALSAEILKREDD